MRLEKTWGREGEMQGDLGEMWRQTEVEIEAEKVDGVGLEGWNVECTCLYRRHHPEGQDFQVIRYIPLPSLPPSEESLGPV